MAYLHNGIKYGSKKFPMLVYIFNKKTNNGTEHIGENITFTLKDVSEGYKNCAIEEPASISNTILDLTRKDRGIKARLPQYIIDFGYDIRKKTGPSPNGNYCGEFIYVGVGNQISSWLVWEESKFEEKTIPNLIPGIVLQYLSNDEGALFSAIDYCDLLSVAINNEKNTIIRIQNPMKWQPNEIDGLYLDKKRNCIYPVEAKAVSTGDSINLEQMYGQYLTIKSKIKTADIIPIAAVSKEHGVDIAILAEENNALKPIRFIRVKILPKINSWQRQRRN